MFGFPNQYGSVNINTVTAIALIRYSNKGSLELARGALPYGLEPIGLVEFGEDEHQELYEVSTI